MSERRHCWIDGKSICYGTGEVTLDHCRLCQRVRLAKLAFRKGQPVSFEV